MNRLTRSVAILAFALAGCGGTDEADARRPIPMGKVPAAAFKAAQKELKGVAFETVFTEKVRGEPTYELSGNDAKGKPHKVRVSHDGKVLSKD